MISVLDSVDNYLVDVWLVFYDVPRNYRFWRWLEPGFNHVEAWRYDRGAWARIDPCLEFMCAEVHLVPPWESGLFPNARYMRVTRFVPRGKVREPFTFGPITCVELTKAVLGIRAIWVRTPFALYNYLRKLQCSSDSSWAQWLASSVARCWRWLSHRFSWSRTGPSTS